MKVIIDRFENDYALVETEDNIIVEIPKALVPNAKEKDVVEITILKSVTEERKEIIENKMNNLFED